MSTIMGGIGAGIGIGTAYGTIVELLRTATTWVKWRALGYSMGRPVIADALQSILSAEKDSLSGLTPTGIVDVIYNFMNHTMDLSLLINESVATQMFVQMIQQSIAYAISKSHAGSIGTLANVYSGGSFLSSQNVPMIGENADLVDRASRGFLSAEVGQNIPTLAFNLTRGINRRIEDVYRSIMRNIDSLLDEWNDLALSYYRHFHSMARTRFGNAIEMKEDIVARAYGFLEQVGNEHLARINEQLDTLDGAKAWFDAGLMSSDELKEISVMIDLERQASEDIYDDYLAEITQAIETGIHDWDDKVSQALGDLQDSERRYALLFSSIFSELFSDVTDFVAIVSEMGDKAIEDTCAYRNIPQHVNIEAVSEIGVGEFSPETEVYRMSWKKWSLIDAITVVYEFQRPRSLRWSDADPEPETVTADALSILPVEEVDESVIVLHYQKPRGLAWESAD